MLRFAEWFLLPLYLTKLLRTDADGWIEEMINANLLICRESRIPTRSDHRNIRASIGKMTVNVVGIKGTKNVTGTELDRVSDSFSTHVRSMPVIFRVYAIRLPLCLSSFLSDFTLSTRRYPPVCFHLPAFIHLSLTAFFCFSSVLALFSSFPVLYLAF